MTKDYYRILGVLDDAEDIVIRAAYKALAQRYHPDKWTGSKEDANKRMSEINEAYGVLSDPLKRKQYDTTRGNQGYQEDNEPDDEQKNQKDINSEEEKAWDMALQFFPSLDYYYTRLRRLDFYLANTFKTFLLENKSFNKADKLSEKYAKAYLQKYFGKNEFIQEYAEQLIIKKKKKAAKKLNEIVTVMGESVSPIQIKQIIEKEFPDSAYESEINDDGEYSTRNNLTSIIQRAKNFKASTSDLIFLTEKVILGKVVKNHGLFSSSYSFFWTDGVEKVFDYANFSVFVKDKVIPLIE